MGRPSGGVSWWWLWTWVRWMKLNSNRQSQYRNAWVCGVAQNLQDGAKWNKGDLSRHVSVVEKIKSIAMTSQGRRA